MSTIINTAPPLPAPGDRVVLKGDPRSPDMTIVAFTQGVAICGWFNAEREFKAIQVDPQAVERVKEKTNIAK